MSAEEFFHGLENEIVAVNEEMLYSTAPKREIELKAYDREDLMSRLQHYYKTCPFTLHQ